MDIYSPASAIIISYFTFIQALCHQVLQTSSELSRFKGIFPRLSFKMILSDVEQDKSIKDSKL